jgi:hypothetical protein
MLREQRGVIATPDFSNPGPLEIPDHADLRQSDSQDGLTPG